ncbi:alpha/beta fold hydrolase [Nonomuraea aurantiaca]|jgi:pimeloyl-ACP methyl ester carboxylesterase|uniref:alpha/beta fold hydrolase n=1 Tax=Nonomuraea aurantiaca TaxID=2878562 RepID=UPI001CDA4C37|nr:alpha/beta hydrolase [Nonomuraea aurantiaca]MCA2224086.1 alpha/beta hydrolase [Nonomuraea aurantiaca]
MTEAKLHDGSTIHLEVHGQGPTVLLPVNPVPIEGTKADEMRKWGVDPALGRNLIDGLSDAFRVVAFDYEGHVLATPKPDTLTPANIAADLLAVADAVDAARFAYYGYSWLALSGLQLAIRTDRLSALVMGGYPPLGGPYAEMLSVTMATYEMSGQDPAPQKATEPNAEDSKADEYDWDSAEVTMTEAQTRQFVTLYEGLQDFDDRAAQASLSCPRLCFAGSADKIEYGERWGGVDVDIAGPMVNRRAELESFGWEVRVLDGLDHVRAMQVANVLPILRPWLESRIR